MIAKTMNMRVEHSETEHTMNKGLETLLVGLSPVAPMCALLENHADLLHIEGPRRNLSVLLLTTTLNCSQRQISHKARSVCTCTHSLRSSFAMHVFSIIRRCPKIAVCAAEECGCGISTKPNVELLPPHLT